MEICKPSYQQEVSHLLTLIYENEKEFENLSPNTLCVKALFTSKNIPFYLNQQLQGNIETFMEEVCMKRLDD